MEGIQTVEVEFGVDVVDHRTQICLEPVGDIVDISGGVLREAGRIQLGNPLVCGGASTIAKQPAEHGYNVRRSLHGRPGEPRYRSRGAIRIEPADHRDESLPTVV